MDGDTIDAMTISLADIEWRNPTEGQRGMAFSDRPVQMRTELMELEGSSLRLYPDTRQFEIGNGHGEINLGLL